MQTASGSGCARSTIDWGRLASLIVIDLDQGRKNK
jgi:hypothetical protein